MQAHIPFFFFFSPKIGHKLIRLAKSVARFLEFWGSPAKCGLNNKKLGEISGGWGGRREDGILKALKCQQKIDQSRDEFHPSLLMSC